MSESSLLQKCCLIGESVTGNPTHFMVEQAFEGVGIDWRFLTFEVTPTTLVDALRGVSALSFSGVILLPSLQRLSWEHVQRHTERSEKTRAVSCLLRRDDRLIGEDLSGESVAAAILTSHPIAGRHAVLLGVGGRGESTAHAVLEHGAASLRIVEMQSETATELIDRLTAAYPDRNIGILLAEDDTLDLPDETDLVISSAWWHKSHDPAVARMLRPCLRPKMVVADARVRSSYTPLLHDAAERGAGTVTGIQMLCHEVAEAVRLWTGVELPMDNLQDAAEEFLGV